MKIGRKLILVLIFILSFVTSYFGVTYVASNLPAGAVFSEQTFYWIPDNSQAGIYEVNFVKIEGEQWVAQTSCITVHDYKYGFKDYARLANNWSGNYLELKGIVDKWLN
jgi:hypothetical protein